MKKIQLKFLFFLFHEKIKQNIFHESFIATRALKSAKYSKNMDGASFFLNKF